MKLRASLAGVALVIGLAGPVLARPGQEFPNTTCTCKSCGAKGADGKAQDVTGQCASVCKDKEVYSKGSEPHDYCKARSAAAAGTHHMKGAEKLKAAPVR